MAIELIAIESTEFQECQLSRKFDSILVIL
jgi:hypothetical protein